MASIAQTRGNNNLDIDRSRTNMLGDLILILFTIFANGHQLED